MRVILVHNYPKGFATGGEGHVFEDEAKILESHGHKVFKLYCSNSEATDASPVGKLRAFWNASWSAEGYNRMARAIRQFKPDIVHVHNFFLILSPSVFKAAHDLSVPVVVTLHNYRMVSPCSQLLRNNRICEACVGKNPWRILIHRCYRNSFWASLLRYRIYYLSRRRYNWERYIGGFLALTEFGKAKLVQSGMRAERIFVVPNCAVDPLNRAEASSPGKGALFIGRITREKGIEHLVQAWSEIDYPLTIVGDGNLRLTLASVASANVNFVGLESRSKVAQRLQETAFLMMPSTCYEGSPLAAIEAMAMGRAIAASGHGAMAAIVKDGVTGLHFRPGDVRSIQSTVRRLICDKQLVYTLGQAGRREYLLWYTPEKHYEALIGAYREVLARQSRV